MMIGYGNPDKIEQDFHVDEFKKQFNPAQYYRKIRAMGIPKEDAKPLTKYYQHNLYQVLLQMFEYKYKVK